MLAKMNVIFFGKNINCLKIVFQDKGRPVAVRWMAPESLENGIFSSQSDVWAFGVLMWEITSLGKRPYFEIIDCNIIQHICAGNILSKPLHCPEELYNLMLNCWSVVNNRPNFMICLETIVTLRENIEDAILHSVSIIRRVQSKLIVIISIIIYAWSNILLI